MIENSTVPLEASIEALPDKIYEKFPEGIPLDAGAISDQIALKIVGKSNYK